MRLQTKILLTILPLVVASFFVLGIWSIEMAKDGIHKATYLYMESVLGHYLEHYIKDYHRKLADDGLDEREAFVRAYQKMAVEQTQSLHLVEKGHLFIIDDAGQLVFCSAKHAPQTMLSIWPQVVSARQSESTPFLRGHYLDAEGERQIYVAERFKPWGWEVFYALPEKEAHQAEARIQTATLAMAAFCALASLLLIVVVSRRFFVKPVNILKHSAERIAQREDIPDIQVKSRDELGELARSMETMSRQLQQHHALQDQWQIELEKEVLNQTRNLRKINQSLQREINEHQQTEDALRQERAQAQMYLDIAGVIMVVINPDETVRLINRKGCELLGYPEQDIVRRNWFDLCIPENIRTDLRSYHQRIINRGAESPESMENVVLTKAGQERLVAWKNKELTDNSGRITGILSSGEDITERRLAEKTLKESEERFQTLLRSVNDVVWSTSLDGSQMLYISPAVEKVSGYDLSSFYDNARLWIDIIHHEDMADAVRDLDTLVELGQVEADYRIVRRDGGTRWIHDRKIVVYDDETGDAVRIGGIASDITERKKLENTLHQAQKLEAIGTLARGIAHDFNNILSAIYGYVELATLDLPSTHPVRENLDNALTGVNRATDLVKQILSFSRQSDQEKEPLELNPLITEVLKLIRASLPATIEIKVSLDPKRARILADPTQIHQVLMNLCTNARHAMQEKGGVLSISLKQVQLDASQSQQLSPLNPGPYVQLSVEDTGPGMPPEVMERIFEPYFTTKEKGEGTGLGLSVVHGIVHGHGGAITVQSQPGIGTVFDIFLPVLEAETQEKSSQSQHQVLRGAESVLFVDDEEALTEVGKKILEALGYQVRTCNSSREALTLFQADPRGFDLIITDMTMPHMTGLELTEKIRRISPSIPIIMCTGFSEQINKEKAAQAGIDRLMMKPWSLPDLARALRELLEDRSRHTASST